MRAAAITISCLVLVAAAQAPAPRTAPAVPPPVYVAAWTEQFDAAYPVRVWTSASWVLTGGPTTPLEARQPDTGKPVWRATLSVPGPLATGDGLVFVAEGARLVALAEPDGTPRWSLQLELDVLGLAAFPGGLLVTTSTTLAAYRVIDGGLVWSVSLSAPPSAPPAASESRVVAALEGGLLVAFDRSTGVPVWRTAVVAAPKALVLSADRLFFVSPAGAACSLLVVNGREDWCYRFGAEPVGPPVIGATRMFVLLKDHGVRALDRRSGNLRWRGNVPFRPRTPLVPRDDALLVGGPDGDLATFDTSTGRRTMALGPPPLASRSPGEAATSLDGVAVAPAGRRVFRLMSTTQGRYTLVAFDPSSATTGSTVKRD